MLPEWLLLGLAITGVLSVVFALVFVVGERLFPTRITPRADGPVGWKRRREIRDYLAAIGERYEEDRVVDGHRVDFYLPERNVAITFDALAYFRLDSSPVYVVLVEHEMPGMHLGDRLPFETLDRRTADSDGAGAAFAVLGLRPDASASEVRAAYRERVKEAHPDRGGDEESFRRLREAYTEARRRTT